MGCRVSGKEETGLVSGRERHSPASVPNLTLFGLLGSEANEQCVPVRGVRSELVASDQPGSIKLNRWWPGMAWRQPPTAGSQSRHYMSRCLRSGRSQMVFCRDLVRPCIVLMDLEGIGEGKSLSGRGGITRRKAKPMRCKKSDGLIVVMTPRETGEEIPLSVKGLGGKPKANRLRRGSSLEGVEVRNECIITH